MKINFITFSCHLTGGNRVVMELINGLSARGHDMRLITFGAKEDLNWINLHAEVNYLTRSLFERIAGYIYRKTFGFQNFPEEETRMILRILPLADVNVATISYSGYAVNRSKSGLPFHYYLHYEPLVREEGYKKQIMEESYFLPTKKIANSTWLADKVKDHTGREVDGIVFPAIDHNIFYKRRERVPPERRKRIRVVSLAKHKWWKGFPDALKAIDIARSKGYDIEFLAFGGSFDRSTLPTEVKHIPFTFVGSKVDEDLARFYSDADILVSASFFESFPLPPLEAMACGTPVVTTQFGTEDYAFHGRNAYVVEPNDPNKLAECLMNLIDNPGLYTQFSREGIKTAERFTWENAAKKMEEIFIGAHRLK